MWQRTGDGWLAEAFEEHRPRLRAVAYRMLGSLPDADDAVQDAWVRFSQSGADGVENLGGYLTTIVARVCLNALRARKSRREDLVGVHVPDPLVCDQDGADPETEALLADSVGLALVVVLDTLAPAERLAFVLHDLFDVPFNEIAPMLERSEAAARQLASRARRQVHNAGYRPPDTDRAAQRAVVDAFFAAAHGGDLSKLAALLHPDVILRADGGAARPQASALLHGAEAVARRAATFVQILQVHPSLVNGAPGAVLTDKGRPVALLGFAIVAGKVAAIDAITDPDRLSRIDLPVPGVPGTQARRLAMTDAHAASPQSGTPAAGRYSLDPVRSSLTLRTRLFGLHSLSATMHIVGGQIDVDPAVPRATVTAAVSAASFSTDNPRRDNDIRSPRFLHADKYPELGYRASTLTQDHGRWTLAGELTVRDVTRPVTLEVDSIQQTGRGFRAHATGRVGRAAFGLTSAQWMGGRTFAIDLVAAADPL